MSRFDGKVALVTGAGSGIGRATAQRLAAEGAAVACVDVHADAARDAAGQTGGAAFPCDVADPEQVRTCVAEVIAWGGRLDVLANVAGIGGSVRMEDLDLQRWEQTLAVNLTGPFLLSQAALPALEAASGSIVNVASVAGLEGIAYAAAYAASKGGLVALTRALAAELVERGVRVNCVCPGGVDTPLVAQFRLPEGAKAPAAGGRRSRRALVPPGDIAAAIAFLASDEAASTTGATLVVNGSAATA